MIAIADRAMDMAMVTDMATTFVTTVPIRMRLRITTPGLVIATSIADISNWRLRQGIAMV